MNKNSSNNRFNVVDIIIIVAVVALIAVLVWLVVRQNAPRDNNTAAKVEYTVRITKVRKEYYDYLSVADIATNSNTGNPIGEIINLRKDDYIDFSVNEAGELVQTVSDEYIDIFVTLRSDATISDTGIMYVDGIKILIGSGINFRVSPFAQASYIIAFENKTPAK